MGRLCSTDDENSNACSILMAKETARKAQTSVDSFKSWGEVRLAPLGLSAIILPIVSSSG
jgi:hypothetical protein